MIHESKTPADPVWSDRASFLNSAGAVEGGLALAALGLAWLFGLDVWAGTTLDLRTLGRTALALLLPLAGFVIVWRWPPGSLAAIKKLLLEILGPPLVLCRWYDLVLLAFLAGVGEELMFRGVIQVGLDRGLGAGVGWIIASLAFGLLHAVTRAYAVLALVMGLYLGGLLWIDETPNLAVPILVHAIYDLAALFALRREAQSRLTAPTP